MNGHGKRQSEIQQIYSSIEHFKLYKIDYSLSFLSYLWYLENFFFFVITSLYKMRFFYSVRPNKPVTVQARELKVVVAVGHLGTNNI
jgi:hypothetical protein